MLQAHSRCRAMYKQYVQEEADVQLLDNLFVKIAMLPALCILSESFNGAVNQRYTKLAARQVKRVASPA